MKDEIIEEIHKYREEYANKLNCDLDLIFEDLQKKQYESERKYVSFSDEKGEQDENVRKAA